MVEQVQVQRPLRLFNVARKVLLHKRTTNVLKRSLLTQRRKKEQASVSNYTMAKHFVEYKQELSISPKVALIKALEVKIRVGNPDLNRRKKKQAGKKEKKISFD